MTSKDLEKSDSTPNALEENSSSANSPPPGFQRSSGPAPARRNSQFSIPPPSLTEELESGLGERDDFSPERAIDEQVFELEAWAKSTVLAERLDSIRFWGMRVLAFLGTATAAVGAGLGQTELAVSAGLFASLAIVVDAAWPSVGDRIARRRAVHDLRELQHQLKIKWDKVRLAHPNPHAPKRIAHALVMLDQIQVKREEIGRYLGEASPGVGRRDASR
jgi:hypothetical protein